MKVVIGSNHNSYSELEELKDYLHEMGHDIIDCSSERDNTSYVAEGLKVAENVAMNEESLGVVVCHKGIGAAVATNKVKGIRGVLATRSEIGRKARELYNSNVLILDTTFSSVADMKNITDKFLSAQFREDNENINDINFLSDYEESCKNC